MTMGLHMLRAPHVGGQQVAAVAEGLEQLKPQKLTEVDLCGF
jgi:hypothetical protein